MKISLTLLLGIMLISTSPAYAQEQIDNQFSLQNGELYFSKHLISKWRTDSALPICSECSKNIYSKSSTTGPMLFRQINDANGELILLYANIRQYGFSLNTGRAQYPVYLQVQDGKYTLLINRRKTSIELNQPIEVKLAAQHYFVLLQSLEVNTNKETQTSSLETKYKADIIIWLNQQALHQG